jgi:hypothetical protein
VRVRVRVRVRFTREENALVAPFGRLRHRQPWGAYDPRDRIPVEKLERGVGGMAQLLQDGISVGLHVVLRVRTLRHTR